MKELIKLLKFLQPLLYKRTFEMDQSEIDLQKVKKMPLYMLLPIVKDYLDINIVLDVSSDEQSTRERVIKTFDLFKHTIDKGESSPLDRHEFLIKPLQDEAYVGLYDTPDHGHTLDEVRRYIVRTIEG